jgi:hypothetical protein
MVKPDVPREVPGSNHVQVTACPVRSVVISDGETRRSWEVPGSDHGQVTACPVRSVVISDGETRRSSGGTRF